MYYSLQRKGLSLVENPEVLKGIEDLHKLLFDSDERFEILLSSLQEGITIHDAQGLIVTANKSAERLLGLKLEEIAGKGTFQLGLQAIHEDGSHYSESDYPSVLAVSTGLPQFNKIIGVHQPDGSLVWLEATSIPVLDSQTKQVTGAVTSLFDITRRKEAEEDLNVYKFLADNANDAFALIREDGSFAYVNTEGKARWGYSDEELLSIRVPDIDPLYPDERFRAVFAEAQKGRVPLFESIHQRKDGSTYPVEISMIGLTLRGRPHIFVVNRDITARKRNREELRKFKFLADNTSDALILMRGDGSFAYLNTKAKQRWGYTDEEARMIRVPDVDPIYHDKKFREVFALAQQQEIPVFETIHKRKDGSLFPVEVNMRGIILDGEPHMFAVARDITERKKAEEALRKSEERLNLAVENAEAGVFDINLLTGETVRSVRHAHIFGYHDNTGEWSLASMFEHVLPEDIERARSDYSKMLAEGSINTSFRIRRVDGQVRWINIIGRIQYNEKNVRVRVLGTITDITEKKELEKQKDEFISTVSHELKTPVTSIKAFTQFLQRTLTGEENEKNHMFLERIGVQINRLEKLIKDLLDVTRVESGKLTLNRTKFEMNLLLAELVSDLQLINSSHKLIVSENKAVTVFADKDRIIQVITNLVNNAVKYSQESDRVLIGLSTSKNTVICSVQDFGKGIPDEQRPYVFQRFHQVNIADMNLGLGLGLYISKEIISQEGGRIWYESEPGKGTTFYFSLPLCS